MCADGVSMLVNSEDTQLPKCSPGANLLLVLPVVSWGEGGGGRGSVQALLIHQGPNLQAVFRGPRVGSASSIGPA